MTAVLPQPCGLSLPEGLTHLIVPDIFIREILIALLEQQQRDTTAHGFAF